MSGPPAAPSRLLSLDAFRGLTIAAMILVNNPGEWAKGHRYTSLIHADWQGWTPADLIFPFFLLIVGVAIPFSLARHRPEAGGRPPYGRILRRTVLLILLGLLLNAANAIHPSVPVMRIPGVLQRIALCYLGASLLFLHLSARRLAAIAGAILAGYALLLHLVPAPTAASVDRDTVPVVVMEVPIDLVIARGLPVGLSREGNLAAWVDRRVFGARLLLPEHDPEGLLGTTGALATTLIGVLAGAVLAGRAAGAEPVAKLAAGGTALFWAGLLLGDLQLIVKSLWTSSYALFTAGLGLQALACLVWVIDVLGRRRWAHPFVVLGRNAILVYVLAELFWVAVVTLTTTGPDGVEVTLQKWLYHVLFAAFLSGPAASLAYASATVLLWLAVAWLLDRRRLYLKL